MASRISYDANAFEAYSTNCKKESESRKAMKALRRRLRVLMIEEAATVCAASAIFGAIVGYYI